MSRRCRGPIIRAVLASAVDLLFRSLAKRHFPIDHPESRVEFRIRKMHSPHLHMSILNGGMEYQWLDQDGSQAGCDRPEPAGGVRRHHAGPIRHTGGATTGAQSACDEPCLDPIASYAERRTVRPQPEWDDADAAGRGARRTDQNGTRWAATIAGTGAVRSVKGDGNVPHCGR